MWILTEAHPELSPGTDYHLAASSSATAELPKGHPSITFARPIAKSTTENVGRKSMNS